MKAVWFTRQGPAVEVLQFGEQPTPHAGPGEVRVRLHASGVNPADIYRRAGINYALEGPLIIPHSDGSGVVDEAGAGAPGVPLRLIVSFDKSASAIVLPFVIPRRMRGKIIGILTLRQGHAMQSGVAKRCYGY